MTRYIMPARSQGKLYAQRLQAERLQAERGDVHRWVFVNGLSPEVEADVLKWLLQRLNVFYCDLQVMYIPHLRLHSAVRARTHIVLNNMPPLPSLARNDEAVEVDARGLNALEAAKALMKATGLNLHMSVYGWPFCLGDLYGINEAEGGEA